MFLDIIRDLRRVRILKRQFHSDLGKILELSLSTYTFAQDSERVPSPRLIDLSHGSAHLLDVDLRKHADDGEEMSAYMLEAQHAAAIQQLDT